MTTASARHVARVERTHLVNDRLWQADGQPEGAHALASVLERLEAGDYEVVRLMPAVIDFEPGRPVFTEVVEISGLDAATSGLFLVARTRSMKRRQRRPMRKWRVPYWAE